MKGLLLAMVLLLSSPLHAMSVYKCEIEDVIIFSQQPCSTQAEEVRIDYIRADELEARRLRQETQTQHARSGEIAVERRIREIETRIDAENRVINRLQRERDRDLNALRNRQAEASDNLAGAAYRQSLAGEMQAVNQRYDSLVAQRQATIQRLQTDIDRLLRQAESLPAQ